MTQSGWEHSRGIRGKRLRVFIFTSIPAAILITVLFINNQDFLRTPSAENGKTKNPVVLQTSNTSGKTTPVNKTGENPVVNTGEKNSVALDSIIKDISVKFSDPESEIIKQKTGAYETKNASPDPVSLSGIECRVSDRSDLLIRFDLDVCFNDESRRKEILLRRNEIRVITKKVMSNKELSLIKREILEPELKNEISSLFDRGIINRVSFRNLQIEKVY
jgi:hypothetical protein